MKFIFPQNYNFNSKLLGMFDYSTVIFNLLWAVFTFCFINLIFHNLNIKIFLFIILYFPIFMFSLIGFNHENILYVFYYLAKFVTRPKVYVFRK